MSNYDRVAPRERGKSLFIVEGNHEKNELIKFLLKFFPELCIRDEDVLIYGTNIYMLYEAILSAYEEDWDSQDVDLPYVVSVKKGYEIPLRKDDFINIVLIFDYERQKTAIYQLNALLKELFHWTNGRDYYTFVRLLFIEIIRHNIYKANKILNGKYEIAEDSIREVYENIELLEILKNQNIGSRDLVNGIIWVLNTSVFIVADYNFSIIETVYGKQSS